ncbi:MAG: hypothetical protein PHE83_15370 [Opitutaceae bacterium]|nr:hypothetical protein [Opitutaceae bacterium]
MAGVASVEFALQGKVGGVEISPKAVPFGLMTKFHQEVADLIAGSNAKAGLSEAVVEVREGSYALVLAIPETLAESFGADMKRLEAEDALGEVDPKRAEVIEKWQERARMETGLHYAVRSGSRRVFRTLTVTARSAYRRVSEPQWVEVEKYLMGEIVEAGGASKTNVHLRPRDSEGILIIDTSPKQLRDEEHPLFREKVLRVRGEQNLRTGELRKLKLIGFENYQPVFDEAAFARMTEAGAKAWAGIGDAAGWVRELRGGHDD